MKYRIIKNEKGIKTWYTVQRKWWIAWHTVEDYYYGSGVSMKFTQEYLAREHIENVLMQEDAPVIKKVVKTF